jgi:hypothetical protein
MLMALDYLNQDELIRIDGLLHKGKYKLTGGPRTTTPMMPDEELIDLARDEPKVLIPIANVIKAAKPPTLSVNAVAFVPKLGNAASPETVSSAVQDPSSDHTSVCSNTTAQSSNGLDKSSISDSPPTSEIKLPTGYTQQQLDESKDFRASLAKPAMDGQYSNLISRTN